MAEKGDLKDAVTETKKKIRAFIMKVVRPGQKELPEDSPLLETLNSIAIFQLAGFIQTSFGVAFTSKDFRPEVFKNLESLARFIEKKRKSDR